MFAERERTYVCVFRGSRDHYEVAIALAERGKLDSLVTDFYTPDALMKALEHAPVRVREYFLKRHSPQLPSRLTTLMPSTSLPLDRPWSMTQNVSDRMGRRAARAARDGALIYSYHLRGYMEAATRLTSRIEPVVNFQVHPVARQIREVMRSDRELTGINAALEPEETIDEAEMLRDEHHARQTDGSICASSFTAQGLMTIGVPQSQIHVSAYGSDRLPQATTRGKTVTAREPRSGRPMRALWVGQLAYRKGPHWAFRAARELGPSGIKLTVATRDAVPSWLLPLPSNVEIFHGVSSSGLAELYASHDIFLMPSIVEGFGLVYLEALAAGLPILATRNSGAPDIATDGRNAVLVPASDLDALTNALLSLSSEPDKLKHLQAGAATTPLPLWTDFRGGIVEALTSIERTPGAKAL